MATRLVCAICGRDKDGEAAINGRVIYTCKAHRKELVSARR